MNNVIELFAQLEASQIRLGLDDGNLRVRGNKAKLTPELLAQIKLNKPMIVAWLKNSEPFGQLSDLERQRFDARFEDAYPLSSLQSGMVYHSQIAGYDGTYHDILIQHLIIVGIQHVLNWRWRQSLSKIRCSELALI